MRKWLWMWRILQNMSSAISTLFKEKGGKS